MFITRPDKKPFAFAGLWETWGKKDQDPLYKSCTIITTEACEALRHIHHRMPVIFKPEAYESWLNPANQDVNALKNILQQALLTDLVSYPVSKRVNATGNKDAACIDPVEG
jgi:putative SOS response-associated peptidase YedK